MGFTLSERTPSAPNRFRELLQNWLFDRAIVSLYRCVYLEDAYEEWLVDYDMLELCVSRRFSASEIYFKGESERIGGQIGELIYLPRQRPFDFYWRRGYEINLCVYFRDVPLVSHDQCLERDIARNLSVGCPVVHGLMRQLNKEISRPGWGSGLIIEGLCLQLGGTLARNLETLRPCRHGEPLAPTTKLRAIIDAIDGRRGSPALAELSEQFGYSRRHFARIFAEATGMTYSQYISTKRIGLAKNLLSETRMPIKEIAFELGFEDSHSFSRAFRGAVGRCPTDYRSDLQQSSTALRLIR